MIDIPISVRLDDDGLLRRECSFCEQQFKVFPEEDFLEQEKYWCPLCGLPASKDDFWTKEQVEKAQDAAYNFMVGKVNKVFSKSSKQLRKNNNISFNYKPLSKKEIRTIIETSDFQEVIFNCCHESVFILSPHTYKVLYCYKCGNMNLPE